MGQVYRARDARLNRDVAIKILPETFATDRDRIARFTREAQTLAALNHPNIAHVYGLEDSPPTASGQAASQALVMELVEGKDLSLVMARGRLPTVDAVAIARQIADALEAAHEQGIIHRDLKPANVKVREDGATKVLDFGLAKALPAGAAGGSGHDLANSPTVTSPISGLGTILGTAAYMSPEQAKGRPVDRRADIWAFGAVLYEMLTGVRLFKGDDVAEVMASVLRTEPDWTALPAETPVAVRRLLRRCLEKDPRKRLSSIGDARLDLDDAGTVEGKTLSRFSLSRLWPAMAGAAIVAALAAIFWPSVVATPAEGVSRVSILGPPDQAMYPDTTMVAVSPDGRTVAFVDGTAVRIDNHLWVRSLDSPTPRRIENSVAAILPFFSPDSQRLGFFTNDRMWIVPVSGGRPQAICDVESVRGATWNSDDLILFATYDGPLLKVRAAGGEPEPATTLDASRKQSSHRFPMFLPDGRHFLYSALPAKNGKFDVFVGSLDGGNPILLGAMETTPIYAHPGWLVFTRHGVLFAQRFDPTSYKLSGEPVSLGDEPTFVLDPALSYTATRAASVTADGALAYFSAPSLNTAARWIDANGIVTSTLDVPPARYSDLSLSPDGSKAILVRSVSVTESSLWLADVARGNATLLSTGPGRNDAPVWSPDSTRVVFASDRDGPQDLFVKSVNDPSPEQVFYRSDVLFKNADAWSADGEWIVLRSDAAKTQQDIWLLPAAGKAAATPFVIGPYRDHWGRPSPDSKWIAYVSEDSGRGELWVQPFPRPGTRTQVSSTSALMSWWTKDGRQLYFVSADLSSLWVVDVTPGASGTIGIGTPRRLATLPPGVITIDAMPDRQKFLALVPEHTGAGSITIVRNWQRGR
jgi:serine/threonine protein kinase